MTRLRKMMLEELQRRNFSEDTIRVRCKALCAFLQDKSPPRSPNSAPWAMWKTKRKAVKK